MINPGLLIFIIFFAIALLFVILFFDDKEFHSNLNHNNLTASIENNDTNLEQEIMQTPFLQSRIDEKSLPFLVFSLILCLLVSITISVILCKELFAVILFILISLAYSLRLYYHFAVSFRTKLLAQIERIFNSIRNNLSSGISLDLAANNALKANPEKPLGPELAKFIKLTDTSFLEYFPNWLINIKKQFNLSQLSKSAQILALQLEHTNNQEQAFVDASTNILERIRSNTKQKNTISISFFTMDFMVLFFFLILFFVIPNVISDSNYSWWESSRRNLVVFISAAVLYISYFFTVFIALRSLK